MEEIDGFDINLDLTDRQLLYNYVERELYQRPAEGSWDISVIRGKANVENIRDKKERQRVALTDEIFTDTRILEKRYRKTTEDFTYRSSLFGGTVRIPGRVIPVYMPGDVVTGTIDIVLKHPLAPSRVTLSFLGWAFVKILVSTGKTAYYVYGVRKYIDQTVCLWMNAKGEDDTGKQGAPSGNALYAGNHSFPFKFVIPTGVPQSTPPLITNKVNQGHIVFRMKATIDMGNLLARGNIVTHKGLWVRKRFDIGQDRAHMAPTNVRKSLSTGTVCIPTGTINATVSLPRSAFVVREHVPIALQVDNASKGVVTYVEAFIRMFGKVRTDVSRLAPVRSWDFESRKVRQGPVAPGMCPVFRMNIPWDFVESKGDGQMFPIGDMNDCDLIDIEYEVCVLIHRKGII